VEVHRDPIAALIRITVTSTPASSVPRCGC
jgi:hypothetical protein